MNSNTYIGNLTNDPDMRYTQQGKAVVSFGLAINYPKRNNDGTFSDGDTLFIRVSAWEKLAENVANSLTKGIRVVVQGKLKEEKYQDKQGQERTSLTVTAEDVAVSLKNATAKIERVMPPGTPTNTAPPNTTSDPWTQPGGTASSDGWGTPQETSTQPPF